MVATFVAKEIVFGWRITLSLYFLCGMVLALCALLLPETPRQVCQILGLCCVHHVLRVAV